MIFELLLSASLAVVPTMDATEPPNSQQERRSNIELIQEMLDSDANLRTLIDESVAELTAKGEVVDGWNRQGVNIEDYFQDNGATFESHVLLDAEDPLSIMSYGSRFELPGIDQWMEVQSHPESLPHHGVVAMGSSIYVGGHWKDEKVGVAYCSIADTISLGSDRPIEELDFDQLGDALVMVLMLVRMGDIDFCSVYSRDDDGNLVETLYDRSGRPYTTLNSFGATYILVTREEALKRLTSE